MLSAGSVAIGTSGELYLTGGLLDPATSITNAGLISGFGTVDGSIANNVGILATGLVTLGIGDDVFGNGTLVLDGAVTGTGVMDILATSDLQLDGAVGSGQTIDFTPDPGLGNGGTLIFEDVGGFAGTIAGFGDTDSIEAIGATSGAMSGNVLTLFGESGEIGTLDFLAPTPGLFVEANRDIVACFLAGTHIEAQGGGVPVEALAIGDRVMTRSGAVPPVKWIGHCTIDCRRHPRPHEVWPIRIRAGAFGDDLPVRDLLLSPEHAVFIDGVLIPIRCLVNGVTIAQEPRDEVAYDHVELDRHDVLLAEGLPSESWLDCGNRAMSANCPITDLHPAFARGADHISGVSNRRTCRPARPPRGRPGGTGHRTADSVPAPPRYAQRAAT